MSTIVAATISINMALETAGLTTGLDRATKSAASWGRSLESQIRVMEMGADQAKLYDLALRGVDMGVRDAVRGLLEKKRAMEESAAAERDAATAEAEYARQQGAESAAVANRARAIFESTRTPGEKYKSTLGDLRSLLDEGAISQDTFARATRAAAGEMSAATVHGKLLSGSFMGIIERLGPISIGLVALDLVSKQIGKLGQAVADANSKYQSGSISVGEFYNQIAMGIPIVGGTVKGFLDIREAITGEQAKLAAAVAAEKKHQDELRESRQAMRQLAEETQQRARSLDDLTESLLRQATAQAYANDPDAQRSRARTSRAEDIGRQRQEALKAAKATEGDLADLRAQISTTQAYFDAFHTKSIGKQLDILKDQLAAANERFNDIDRAADRALAANEQAFDAEKVQAFNDALKDVQDTIDAAVEAAEGLDDIEQKVRDFMANPMASTEDIIKYQEALENADAFKKSQEDAKAFTEEVKRLTEDTRTPLEMFQEKVQHIRDLMAKGLDTDVGARAIDKARQDYQNALEQQPIGEQKLAAHEFRFASEFTSTNKTDDLVRKTEDHTRRASDTLDLMWQKQQQSDVAVVEIPA